MTNPLKKLALSASYITSCPGLAGAESAADLSGLSAYLPAVGIFIGLFLALIFSIFNYLHVSGSVTAFLLTLAWLAATGGIHMDGWMDAADGLCSCREREKMLEIMKDSRVGNFGAMAGIMLIISKIVSLISLPGSWILPALLLIPAWARFVEVFAIAAYPYARPEGMGKIWHDTTGRSDLLLSAALPGLLTLFLCFYFQNRAYSLLIPLTVLPGILFTYRVSNILHGHTGDTYGASVEFSEAAGLILLSVFYKFI